MGEISCLFLQSKNLFPVLMPEKGGFWIFAPFHLWKMETRNSQTRPSVAVFWSRAVGSKSLWNSFFPNFFPELILGLKNALIHSTNFKFLPSNLYPFRIPPPGSNFSAQNFKIFKTSKREISNFRNFKMLPRFCELELCSSFFPSFPYFPSPLSVVSSAGLCLSPSALFRNPSATLCSLDPSLSPLCIDRLPFVLPMQEGVISHPFFSFFSLYLPLFP